ncbi:protein DETOXIFICATION 16-like isoform X2 [Momordica charantia]|uniref:Protein DETOXIFICATION n=1 Tax=Momordica charantia TaxID=3673 RepID=A0A6J1C0A2_MOMCH|nr:protein DETOXIFICATION 16-like isoform X2 [Momordica charantia]
MDGDGDAMKFESNNLEAHLLLGEPQRDLEVVGEVKKQLTLAGPLVVVSFLQYSLQLISIMFIGHLGELPLSGASMALSFAGVTGFSLLLGMGSALETLCGQAYGAKQYHMLGIHMQRGMVVLSILCIPIALLWASIPQIFTLLKQDPLISEQAGIYAQWLIPSIIPYGLLQCQLRFLQAQHLTSPLLVATAASSLIHLVVCWGLVFGCGFGIKGAAFSTALTYWINVLILGSYINFSPECHKTWTGFSKDGINNLVGFLGLAVPSSLMVCLEFWSYEFLVLMSGVLPNPQLETSMMSISISTSSLVFRIAYGFGSAVSTRVSNELGAGKAKAAAMAVRVVVVLGVAEGIALGVLLISLRNIWGYLFTNEQEVISYLSLIMPVLAVSNFMDAVQGVLSGTARGCGWQKIGAWVNLGAYYLVGLPCAIIFTFVFHFGGKGLWMGITCGSCLQSVLLLFITFRTNWDDQARKAKERMINSAEECRDPRRRRFVCRRFCSCFFQVSVSSFSDVI